MLRTKGCGRFRSVNVMLPTRELLKQLTRRQGRSGGRNGGGRRI